VADAFVLRREMGCTPEELARWLPGATGGAAPREQAGEVVVVIGGGEVRITAEPRPARRIAGLSLPVLAVTFTFRGLDEPARRAFLARFDAWTQRGGG
jgi:hypothetical protein